jgi:hypothetical protein
MRFKEITGGIPGFVSVTMTAAEKADVDRRKSDEPLHHGPCIIIDRCSGLAPDSTTEPKDQTRPVLWTVHALPWGPLEGCVITGGCWWVWPVVLGEESGLECLRVEGSGHEEALCLVDVGAAEQVHFFGCLDSFGESG